MSSLFNTAVYEPIYNALAFTLSSVPGGDLGIAIVIVTVLVRLILFPLSWAAIRTQIAMRRIEPELKRIRVEHKDNQEELAKKTMALFKDNKINPFAGFFLILIQLPVIIGLYMVLNTEKATLSFDPAILYSFVTAPVDASIHFLGLIDLSGQSFVLAAIVAATQFIFARLMMPPMPQKAADEPSSFQEDFQKSMSVQMKYVFPVVLGVVAYVAGAAIALYFVVSNTFSIGQELFVRKLHNAKG